MGDAKKVLQRFTRLGSARSQSNFLMPSVDPVFCVLLPITFLPATLRPKQTR